jgi:hypothetical protein
LNCKMDLSHVRCQGALSCTNMTIPQSQRIISYLSNPNTGTVLPVWKCNDS